MRSKADGQGHRGSGVGKMGSYWGNTGVLLGQANTTTFSHITEALLNFRDLTGRPQ